MKLVFCVFALLCCSAFAAQKLVNEKVARSIDLQTNVVIVTTDVTLRNDGSNAETQFDVFVPAEEAQHLSEFAAQSKSDLLVVSDRAKTDKGTKFTVNLKSALSTSETVKVSLIAAFTHALTPFPAEITQQENQFVLYHGNQHFYSPYPTESETTTISFPSPSVESYTESSKASLRGSNLVYGPFTKTAPFTHVAFRAHFQNNYPFMTLTNVLKEVEISHWGHLSVEEHIDLAHTGAILKGGFSRLDYQRNPGASPSHFRGLRAHLPASAHGIYYRDIIGNISTSRAHVNHEGGSSFMKLELFPRYLLFGGWKTEFYYGYVLPLSEALGVATDGTYHVQVPFGTAILGSVVNNLKVRVILPEGSSDIKVSGIQGLHEERSVRYTYLDTRGRPVIELTKQNVFKDNTAILTVSYRFSNTALYFDVALVVAGFFALFLLAIVAGRIRLAIGKEGYEVSKWKENAQELSVRLHAFDSSVQKKEGDAEAIKTLIKNTFVSLKKEMIEFDSALTAKVNALESSLNDLAKLTKRDAKLFADYSQKLQDVDGELTSKL